MKSISMFFVAVFAVALFATASQAQGPFRDLPADHWAYSAVQMLYDLGFMEGFPDQTYRGNRTITRYEVAQVFARVWMAHEEDLTGGGADPGLAEMMNKMAQEFRSELADLGVQVDDILAALDDQGSEIDRLKSMIHDTNITGMVRVRTGGFVQNNAAVSATGGTTDLSTDIAHELYGQLNFHFVPSDVMDFDLSLVYAENYGGLGGLNPSTMSDPRAAVALSPRTSLELDVAKITIDALPWITWFGDTPTFTVGRQYFSFGEYGLAGDNGFWSDFGYRFDTNWGETWDFWLGAYRLSTTATSAGLTPFVYGPSRSFTSTFFTTESDDFLIAGIKYNGPEGTVPGHDRAYQFEFNAVPEGYGEELYFSFGGNAEVPWVAGEWLNGVSAEWVLVVNNLVDRDPDDYGIDPISWIADLDIYNNGNTKLTAGYAQISQLEGIPVYSNVDNDPFSEFDFTMAANGEAFNISREGKNFLPADFDGFGVSIEHTFGNDLFAKVLFYDGERRNSRLEARPGMIGVMFKYPLYDNATVGLDVINAGLTDGLDDISTLVRGELLINF